jgi:hypothetical protein
MMRSNIYLAGKDYVASLDQLGRPETPTQRYNKGTIYALQAYDDVANASGALLNFDSIDESISSLSTANDIAQTRS